MHIYLDRKTGEWGWAKDLVFVDADIEGQMMDPEGDAATVYAFLDSIEDDERVDYAESMVDTAQPGFVGTYVDEGAVL